MSTHILASPKFFPEKPRNRPRSSRTKLSNSAIRFRKRVFSSILGSSLHSECQVCSFAPTNTINEPQRRIVHLVDTQSRLSARALISVKICMTIIKDSHKTKLDTSLARTFPVTLRVARSAEVRVQKCCTTSFIPYASMCGNLSKTVLFCSCVCPSFTG